MKTYLIKMLFPSDSYDMSIKSNTTIEAQGLEINKDTYVFYDANNKPIAYYPVNYTIIEII